MKINQLLLFLIVSLLFANQALSLPPAESRGIYVWGYNLRYYEYTDYLGVERYSGIGKVRIYQSEANDLEDFELDWQWGVVFTETGSAWGEEYLQLYWNQSWYGRTMNGETGLVAWLGAHYCAWAEPTVWAERLELWGYPPGCPVVGGQIRCDLRVIEEVREEESTHFHGWYYFPSITY